jgi:hypothetical protein
LCFPPRSLIWWKLSSIMSVKLRNSLLDSIFNFSWLSKRLTWVLPEFFCFLISSIIFPRQVSNHRMWWKWVIITFQHHELTTPKLLSLCTTDTNRSLKSLQLSSLLSNFGNWIRGSSSFVWWKFDRLWGYSFCCSIPPFKPSYKSAPLTANFKSR